MKLREFLAMIAFENACSDIDSTPQTYGVATWRELYDLVSEHEECAYETITGEVIWLTEDESQGGHTLATALQKAYNEAAWILHRAQSCGVAYEEA